jgi:tripeptide aminopeptidase
MPRFTSALAEELAEDVLERFLRYVRVDTRSALDRTRSPSTPGQLELARMLADELGTIGLDDVDLDDNGYVTATLPGDGPVIGLLAHVDTSPEVSGSGVEPLVHRDYDGLPIELPRGGVVVDGERLRGKAGEDIVTASGDTLLGADDKAGVAEIMGAVAHLARHPELPRPTLRIGFTPDEEIGEGASLFDIARFGARCAYTLDGSTLGELTDETFSGWEALVTFRGVDIHPGFATGKLVSALRLAGRFVAALPADQAPETTSGREGFIHPFEAHGGTAEARVRLILRDFDDGELQVKADLVRRLADEALAGAPGAGVDVVIREQYPNMRRFIEPHPEIVETARRAMEAEGIEPIRLPIRGGTDGSKLSEMGLPTPNIFAGGHEFHSPREWVSVQDMAAAAAVVVRLAGEWAGAA